MNLELEKKLKTYRLTVDEFEKIKILLKREPQGIEWALFSALWSEHCSYKSSKNHLKKFSFRNGSTPSMDGENAGVVDLGYGEKIAFKMESHNHPSFIEPVQGSATGVGGILRDIFTMGARPIMTADYLCFGELTAERMPYLMKGVAHGISSYGNCVGVPTVSGQTNIHPKYNKNILVNALNIGYFAPGQKMALSKASGPGNLIVYVGAKTGRDGVHGASMASASFDEDSESKKPNVQIGDPFYEKLLIEACLEVLAKDLVVAMQDMGAAGLTSSSFEMSSRGQVGFDLDLKKVPLRDPSMSAEDILLSESQERMLLICKPEKWDELQRTFQKWNLDSAILGKVQTGRKIKLTWGVETLTEIDPDLIIEEAPRYDRPFDAWIPKNKVVKLPASNLAEKDFNSQIQQSLNSMKLNRFSWIYNQFDQRVGARTAKACESSVAFCKLDYSARGLSVAVGCRPEVMEMDARLGALDAIYYPAFQMALKGADILAVTDCLNFGNPQKKEIMTEFVTSVDALVEASEKMNAPVISGNVSFYNETLTENIISTPATGVVGIRDSVIDIIPDHFQNSFESIVHVQFDWVKANIWTCDNGKQHRAQFQQTESSEVARFIKRCQKLDAAFKTENLSISSIKAVGLGGLGITCLKSVQASIGFDLSFDHPDVTQLFQDQFYSFILTTKDFEKVKTFLKKHFSDMFVEINKIGETVENTICFSKNLSLNFAEFTQHFTKGL